MWVSYFMQLNALWLMLLLLLPVDDDYGDADDGGALEYEDVNE